MNKMLFGRGKLMVAKCCKKLLMYANVFSILSWDDESPWNILN